MPTPTPLYLGNDHRVKLDDLVDYAASSMTAATVNWYLYEEESEDTKPDPATATPIASDTSLTATDNDYAGAMESSAIADLVEGEIYWLRITAVESGKNGEWWIRCRAMYRQPGS